MLANIGDRTQSDSRAILKNIQHDFPGAAWARADTTAADIDVLVAAGCTAEDYDHAVDRWVGATAPDEAWPIIREYMPNCAARRRERQMGW
jgi:hypothetical protein